MAKNIKDAPGMKGPRSRNEKGPLRRKRDDTKVRSIERDYGVDLHVRDDMLWRTYKKSHDVKSVNDLINGK
ncbi:MAG: hypothetical protein U0517_00340 [Candidatus Andersenbacteria bacterium]